MTLKQEKLKQLEVEMLENKKLPLKSNLVFGEGSASAKIVFIGEAPGAKEDELGRPLEIIKPKIIVSLGRFALNYFFPDLKISEAQGRILDYKLGSEAKFTIRILPIFHPAAAFRKKETLREFKKSFQVLLEFLNGNKKL